MALVADQKFSTFHVGGDLEVGDTVVGLRGGINTKFNWTLPASVASITGTANEVLVNGTTGSPIIGDVTLSLPQGIGTTSIPTFAAIILSSALTVANGGSGVQAFTPYSLIAGGTTSTGALQNISGVGTIGQVLASNGASALPTWQSVPGLVASALTEVNDTNITLTLGGTPSTALLQAVSITAGWTGTLSPARGGTGVNNGSNTITLGGTLTTSGAFNSTFNMTGTTSVTFPTSGTLATTSQLPAGAALTKTDDTNVTLTLGGTPNTALLQATSITLGWTGTLSPTRGGTGVNNGSNTLTLAGTLATSGAFSSTFTMTGATNVTFPTSGTLATVAATVASITGTANQIAASSSTGAVTLSLVSNAILPGTGGVTLPSGNTASRAGGAGTLRFNSQTSVFESTVDGTTWATIETSANGVISITGTANQVISSASSGAVTLSLPQSIATSSAVTFGSVAFSTTSGIIGTTTNNSAAAGSVGELMSVSILYAGRTSLTTGTLTNVMSLALTAGDWDVYGIFGIASTLSASLAGTVGFSSVSATLPDNALCNLFGNTSTSVASFIVPAAFFQLSAPTTIDMVVNVTFTGTGTKFGSMFARRRR